MATKADITQRDRDAVTLAIYECMLAAACALKNDVESIQGEAAWISPPTDQWAQWKGRRRLCEGPKREDDSAK